MDRRSVLSALRMASAMHEDARITLSTGVEHVVPVGEVSEDSGTADLRHGSIEDGWEWFIWDPIAWSRFAETWPPGTWGEPPVVVSAVELSETEP